MVAAGIGKGLIILDRDGVINHDSEHFIKNVDEWQPIPGSLQAIAALTEAGFTLAIASNQSGIARGLFDQDALDAMHAKMLGLINAAGGHIGRVVICPHGPDDDCACRKPRPGMLEEAARRHGLSLSSCVVVGDKRDDLKAAKAAGGRAVLVLTGKGRAEVGNQGMPPEADAVLEGLSDAADWIMGSA